MSFDRPCEYCGTMLDTMGHYHSGLPNVRALVYHTTEYCRERLSERCEKLEDELAAMREWKDVEDEWSEAINAAFPTRSGSHGQYGVAMKMVGNRHSKGELVALVNWLLVMRDNAHAAAVARAERAESELEKARYATSTCRHCGSKLPETNYWIADGCPCNCRRGINHGIVPKLVCTCVECDPAQTGSSRYGISGEKKP